LDESNELIQDGENLRFIHEVRQVSVLLLIVIEVLLVMHLLILLFPHLFDLVVVDIKLLAIEVLLVELSLCL